MTTTTTGTDNLLQAAVPHVAARRGSAGAVDYCYARVAELDAPFRRPRHEWLSAGERRELAAWRHPSRRAAWLRGRWLAKRCVTARFGDEGPPAAIEILSLDAAGKSTRPRLMRDGAELPWSLSISHTSRGVLVGWCDDSPVSLGVDLTVSDAVVDSVVRSWFTADEQEWVRRDDRAAASFIWAAKEAIYKACNRGESFAPRQIRVLSPKTYSYRGAPLGQVRLQSFHVDGHIAVVATVAIDSNSSFR